MYSEQFEKLPITIRFLLYDHGRVERETYPVYACIILNRKNTQISLRLFASAEKQESEKSWGIEGSAGTTGLLAKFVSVSLKGSVSSKSREESTMNRSGMLEITVHASESPIPEGLAKILNLLSASIPASIDQVSSPADLPVRPAGKTTPAKP